MTELWCWRHPRAQGAAGRCIGRTDLAVDPRKAKRLAHRIRQTARRHDLPHVLQVSPLRRSLHVGHWLQRWGWRLVVDARLSELDFGRWDGQHWADVPWAEVGAWQQDLLHHAPGGGESLGQLAARVQAFVQDFSRSQATHASSGHCLLVSHGGWINALMQVRPGQAQLQAADWPAPLAHGSLKRVQMDLAVALGCA